MNKVAVADRQHLSIEWKAGVSVPAGFSPSRPHAVGQKTIAPMPRPLFIATVPAIATRCGNGRFPPCGRSTISNSVASSAERIP